MTRRTFIRNTAVLGAGGVLGTAGYGFWEAAHIQITRQTVKVPNLPPAFEGKTVAVLADLHHGPFVGIEFIRSAVRLTNSLNPDLIALVGDYAHKGKSAHIELPPCLEALSDLKAPLGVFAVPGNHDMQRGGDVYQALIADMPLTDLTNRHRTVSLNGEHLYLAGVDDLWWGQPDLARALTGVPTNAAVVLLSHNPDFAETRPDPRVGRAGLPRRRSVVAVEVRSEVSPRPCARPKVGGLRVAWSRRSRCAAATQRPARNLHPHAHLPRTGHIQQFNLMRFAGFWGIVHGQRVQGLLGIAQQINGALLVPESNAAHPAETLDRNSPCEFHSSSPLRSAA